MSQQYIRRDVLDKEGKLQKCPHHTLFSFVFIGLLLFYSLLIGRM